MSKEDVKLFTCYGARASGRSYMEHLKAKDKEIERLNKRWKVLRTYINESLKYHISDKLCKEVGLDQL